MKRLFILLALVAVCAAAFAQMGPETGMLAKSLLGIDGLAVLEVALPSEVSYNPAAVPLALDLYEEKAYVEADYGTLNFKEGPEVTNSWLLYAFRVGDCGVRVARYSIDSDPAATRFAGPDYPVSFEGETYEVSAGMRLNEKVSIGLACVPYEQITTTLSDGTATLATFKAKTKTQWRAGAVYAPTESLSFGAVYSEGRAESRMTLIAPTEEGPMEFYGEDDYTQKLVTLGVGFQPIRGTILSAAWQRGSVKGDNMDADIDLAAYGLKQYLTPDFSVNVSLNDRTWGYGAVYSKGGTTLGVSYAPDAYRAAEDYLGRAQTWYFWFGKSW